MTSKIKLFILAVLAMAGAAFAFGQVAQAETPGWTQYTPAKFEAATKSGKVILVDVHADWCPTCKAQQPILEELRSDARMDGVLFMKVNFDDDKAFLRAHRIPRQSTILVFNGTVEKARSIAETNRVKLRKLVLAAI